MTAYTARTIGTQDTAPLPLAALTIAAAKQEADQLLGDMFRGDTLVVEYENHAGTPVIAASRTIGEAAWTQHEGAQYVD